MALKNWLSYINPGEHCSVIGELGFIKYVVVAMAVGLSFGNQTRSGLRRKLLPLGVSNTPKATGKGAFFTLTLASIGLNR